jgi:hypothetical protein
LFIHSAKRRSIGEELKEFKELQEFKERSQEPESRSPEVSALEQHLHANA